MKHAELWVLDFDRCLGSEAIYTAAEEALERLSPDARSRIVNAREQMEREGGSFDLVSYLEENDRNLRDDFLTEFARITSTNNPEMYRNKGATMLLDYLKAKNIPYVIMTYGGAVWQMAKLKAAQLDSVPYMVIDSKFKADTIRSWHQASKDGFIVPVGSKIIEVSSVCLVDDKAQAFNGLPEQARGYWIKGESELLKSQQGIISDLVTPVYSLEDILKIENEVTSR